MSKLFSDTLREYRNGSLVRHLSEELAAVVLAVQKERKPGSLKLTLTLTPDPASDYEFSVQAGVAVSIPKPSLPKATFFADRDGGLFRTDPNQNDFFDEDDRPILRDTAAE
jgi:hypothetical protein